MVAPLGLCGAIRVHKERSGFSAAPEHLIVFVFSLFGAVSCGVSVGCFSGTSTILWIQACMRGLCLMVSSNRCALGTESTPTLTMMPPIWMSSRIRFFRACSLARASSPYLRASNWAIFFCKFAMRSSVVFRAMRDPLLFRSSRPARRAAPIPFLFGCSHDAIKPSHFPEGRTVPMKAPVFIPWT